MKAHIDTLDLIKGAGSGIDNPEGKKEVVVKFEDYFN